MKNKNFSIISYLTGESHKIVRGIQKEISQITGSKKCLVDWLPHITIGDGITVSEERLSEIDYKLKNFADKQNVFKVKTKSFDGVDDWKGAVEGIITPYVIQLDVEKSEELLNLFNNLKNTIISKEKTWLPRTVNYSPHITIAFYDLNKEGYEKGLYYLKDKYKKIEFAITHISLAECYGEYSMSSVEYKKFYFK